MDDHFPIPPASIEDADADESTRPLARNSACHQCRRRKLKCDAVRPTCNNCARPRQRRVDKSQPPELCSWDEPKEPSARTMRKRAAEARRVSGADDEARREGTRDSRSSSPQRDNKRDRLDRMESRINELQDSLRKSTMANPFAPGGELASLEPKGESATHIGQSNNPTSFMNPTVEDVDTLLNIPTSLNHLGNSSVGNAFGGDTMSNPNNLMSWLDDLPQLAGNGNGDGSLPFDPLYGAGATSEPPKNNLGNGMEAFSNSLVWPDWPRDLPTLPVVEHVVSVFFDRVPTAPKMLHRHSFISTLQLPPSHPKFPETALLHAILAATAPFLSLAFLADRNTFPVGTSITAPTHPEYDFEQREPSNRMLLTSFRVDPERLSTPLERFQYWHRRKAMVAQGDSFNRGTKFLQTTQALVIATLVDQMNGWWTDLWVETGSCVRMSVPLKLHESPNVPIDALKMPMNSLLGPAENALDQAERDRTWWMIFLTERLVSGSTSWPSCITDGDITVELPVSQEMFDNGVGNLTGSQTLSSARLLSHHPPEHVDSFCLLIKSVKLYYETNVFLRGYMRGSHIYSRFMSDPGLRRLLADIHSFRLSFPAHMRRPLQRMPDGHERVDPDLFGALTMTHCSALALGEPMISPKTWSDDAARMSLSAVRAILSLIYDVSATSYDVTLLPNLVSYSWCLAAKCLVRFMRAASATNDHVSANVFSSELQVFRGALAQYGAKHPLGMRHLKIVDGTLASENTEVPYECTVEDILDTDYLPSSTKVGSNNPTPQPASTPAQSTTGSTSFPPSMGGTGLTPNVDPSSSSSWLGSGSGPSASQSPLNLGLQGSTSALGSGGKAQGMGAGVGLGGMGVLGDGLGPTTPSAWMTAIDETFDISSFAFDVGALEKMMGIDNLHKAA